MNKTYFALHNQKTQIDFVANFIGPDCDGTMETMRTVGTLSKYAIVGQKRVAPAP